MSVPTWHADEHGRCHEQCEAWVNIQDPRNQVPCKIAAALPFYVCSCAIRPGELCPFAILAGVLLCHTSPP
jgi:hypothetical protein